MPVTESFEPSQFQVEFDKIRAEMGIADASGKVGEGKMKAAVRDMEMLALKAEKEDPGFLQQLADAGYIPKSIDDLPPRVYERTWGAVHGQGDYTETLTTLKEERPYTYRFIVKGLIETGAQAVQELRKNGGSVEDEMALREDLAEKLGRFPDVTIPSRKSAADIQAERGGSK